MEDQENKVDGKLLPVADPLLEKIKNTIWDSYEPVQEYGPTVIMLSTQEIYNQMQRLYPGGPFGMDDVAKWMNEKGFKFVDMGHMNWEWILKTAITK